MRRVVRVGWVDWFTRKKRRAEGLAGGAAPGGATAEDELNRLRAEASGPRAPTDDRVLELAAELEQRGLEAEALALLEGAARRRGSWSLVKAALDRLLETEAWDRAWPLIDEAYPVLKLYGTEGLPAGEAEFLRRAHELVLTRLEGAEAVTVDLLRRGELDPFSGANHLLLAKALMKQGRLSTRLELVSAPQELREGEARLVADRTDATGLMLRGSAKLRLGELDEARQIFEKARLVAPQHFALVAGLGATRALQQSRNLERVARLPALAQPADLDAVLPDLPQLTALERRVALASVGPLAHWLPELQRAGATLRVLPLDVRVTDLPDFETLRGEVEERDGRAWDGLGGLAGDGLACVRVEELFDLGEFAWTLAHEFAHLVHGVLPDELTERLREGWERACEAEYAFDQYQLYNEYEFFAVTYTRWLARRYRLPLDHETDEEGHLAQALTCIDEVRGQDR